MSGSSSRFVGLRPPIRRVAGLDPGSRTLHLLLAEMVFGRMHVTRQEVVDIKAEGLVSAEETREHLLERLAEWGAPPVALVLPQHLSTSQLIDVPLAPESEIKKLIEDETKRLSGVSESRIVYDFVRTAVPAAKNRQQFWVTLAQEGEIRERILRLGLDPQDLCEVTTAANALLTAFNAAQPANSNAVLVHMGAQTTIVIVQLAGQGAFATSFQMGGDFLTRALARGRNVSEDAAEELKQTKDLFHGAERDPEFVQAVDGWIAELNRQLKDWFDQHSVPGPERSKFDLLASGGGFEQRGLLEHIQQRASLALRPWKAERTAVAAVEVRPGFELAFGAALQALGLSAQPVSLLPEENRAAWQKRLGRQRLEFASFLLIVVCVLAFALGTWHNLSLIARKEALRGKIDAGLDAVRANNALTSDLVSQYEEIRPLFAAQQNTLDTLKTLALLTQSRSNRSLWYALVADQNSYFDQPPASSSTNRTARTNVVGAANGSVLVTPSSLTSTNLSPARPGLIAELCIPEEPEAARHLLSQVVAELQQQRLFSKVDLLSEDLRRGIADPKVIITDRQYVLALDFVETDFQKAAGSKRPAAGQPTRPPRHGPRSSSGAAESAELNPGGQR